MAENRRRHAAPLMYAILIGTVVMFPAASGLMSGPAVRAGIGPTRYGGGLSASYSGGTSRSGGQPRLARLRKALYSVAGSASPLRFELNQGQTDSRVRFVARGLGYGLFLTDTDAVLALVKPLATATGRADASPAALMAGHFPGLADLQSVPMTVSVVSLHVAGADAHAQVTGLDRLPGTSNYSRPGHNDSAHA